MMLRVKCWRNSIGSKMDRRDVRLVTDAAGPSVMLFDLEPELSAEMMQGRTYTVEIKPCEASDGSETSETKRSNG